MLVRLLKDIFRPQAARPLPVAEARVSSAIPDAALYRPLYSPWLAGGDFAKYYAHAAPRTLVSPDRCYVLYALLLQSLGVEGDVWECGVYQGGTAAMIAAVLAGRRAEKRLWLFDTFEGMPHTDPGRDLHKAGDFADTSLESVAAYLGHAERCVLRKGEIPSTFAGLEGARIALAHIDLDIYQAVGDSLRFIWPRLSRGGFIVCDDYGFPTCPGARIAVDEFFSDGKAVPLCLPTGQAIVFRSS